MLAGLQTLSDAGEGLWFASSRSVRVPLVGVLLMGGCVPEGMQALPSESTTGVVDGSSTSGIELVEAESSSSGLGFLPPPDVGQYVFACDIWAHDCPAGEKCMPWANDGGGSWNATRCSPIVEDPAGPGEPCLVDGNGVSGLDDCELASMCWDVDPETNEGTCVPMCTGSAQGPLCEDPDLLCVQAQGGALNLCLPQCHPVEQTCPEGQGCYPDHEGFRCRPDVTAGTGQLDDPCEFTNACIPGAACMADGPHARCPDGASACCRPFCTVGELGPPCSVIEHCAPWEWFVEGQAPARLEDVGYCAFPDL